MEGKPPPGELNPLSYVAQRAKELRKDYVQMMTLREMLSMISDNKPVNNHRPNIKRLQAEGILLDRIELEAGGFCEAYASGEAIYNNGDRVTLVWIPLCITYREDCDKINKDIPDHIAYTEDDLLDLPWEIPVSLYGEQRIWWNMNHSKSKSDRDLDENAVPERALPTFPNPEAEVIRKETIQEALAKLTDRQREVYLLYHWEGYTQEEIADRLGISHQGVCKNLKLADSKIGQIFPR